ARPGAARSRGGGLRRAVRGGRHTGVGLLGGRVTRGDHGVGRARAGGPAGPAATRLRGRLGGVRGGALGRGERGLRGVGGVGGVGAVVGGDGGHRARVRRRTAARAAPPTGSARGVVRLGGTLGGRRRGGLPRRLVERRTAPRTAAATRRTGRGLLLGGPRTTAVAPVAAAAPAARPTAARLAQVLQLLRVEPGAGALRARQHPLGALGDPEVRVEVGGGGVRLLRVAETEVQRL